MGINSTRRAGVTFVVALLLAACGGTSAEVEAFCTDFVEVNGLMTAGPDESDPAPWVEQLTAGLGALKENAPEEVSAAVGRIAESVLGPVSELDQEAYFAVTQSPEFLEDSAIVDEFIGAECGFANVEVTAIDYAFDADFEGIEAGVVAFDFTNAGTELHEMALVRINDDVTESLDQLLALPEEESDTKGTFVNVAFAEPGDSSTLFTELEAGRYAVVCFIPTGTTSMEEVETAQGPPHFTQGMAQEFTVGG